MGESVKIKDLIHKMINLSGLTLKDDKNPNGDIEIKIIGLRSGEKLFEELLLGENPQKTNHPKILTANDTFVKFELLEIELKKLKNLLDSYSAAKVKNLLEKIIKLYKSNSKIVDHVYNEQMLHINKKN